MSESTSEPTSECRPGATTEFGTTYAASQIARRDSGWRSRIKQFYLDRILEQVRGPTVDIGCGAGQLLEQLPSGSVGLEVNEALVADLRSRGLAVLQSSPDESRIALGMLSPGRVRTAVLSHVLEHFADAAGVLRGLMHDGRRLGISRLVVVVPGRVGYASDATHKTFVALDYLSTHGLLDGPGFRTTHRSYFPGDFAILGRLFIYHELMLVYELDPMRDDGPA